MKLFGEFILLFRKRVILLSNFKKILVTSTSFSKIDQEPIDLLKKNNFQTIWKKGPLDDENLANIVEGYDAIIVGNDFVGEKTLNQQKNLKVIVKHGVGIDNINVELAKKKGIKILNAPHTNAIAVAEHVFACLLSLIRKVCESRISLLQGKWEGSEFIGTELYGKTLGIVGSGHIGQNVARIGNGFGMKIEYFDVMRCSKIEKYFGAKFMSLKEILHSADIITIHIPLLQSTIGLIGEKEISMMKPEAYLVNMARGDIVDEEALYQALLCKKIKGAVLDVFKNEPINKEEPILKLSNILCTPHIAGYTVESVKRTSISVAQKLIEELPKI